MTTTTPAPTAPGTYHATDGTTVATTPITDALMYALAGAPWAPIDRGSAEAAVRTMLATLAPVSEIIVMQIECAPGDDELDVPDESWRDGQFFTVCPHCSAVNSVEEEDAAYRYNPTPRGTETRDGLPLLRFDYGGDSGDYDHFRFLCRRCSATVALPDFVTTDGTW